MQTVGLDRVWLEAHRRSHRHSLTGEVKYGYGLSHSGMARWLDMSDSGARLSLGRYVRPGTLLKLAAAADAAQSAIQSVVVWCRPAGEACEFEAGLRFLFQSPEERQFAALVSELLVPAPSGLQHAIAASA